MILKWSWESKDNPALKEDCPRGNWTGHDWPVKIGSSRCKECEYNNGITENDDGISGTVDCLYKEE